MIFLYISMVRSSYIIILPGMGDDVPILGALVTHLTAMGNCCFWWCFYTSVWSDHHISSLYLVWEMTCQFWVQWSHFLEAMGYCCFGWYFLDGSLCPPGQCGYLVIWSSGHLFFLSIVHLVNMVIWSSGRYGHLVNMVIWSSWSSGQYGHLVISSSGHLVHMLIW